MLTGNLDGILEPQNRATVISVQHIPSTRSSDAADQKNFTDGALEENP